MANKIISFMFVFFFRENGFQAHEHAVRHRETKCMHAQWDTLEHNRKPSTENPLCNHAPLCVQSRLHPDSDCDL